MVYTQSQTLRLHRDAEADLAQLKKDVPGVHTRLFALLVQLRSDEKLLAKLLNHEFGKDKEDGKPIGVSKWFAPGKNLWRLKCWELEEYGWKYRLIYVYLPTQARFVVMGVFPREDFDYDDPSNPLHKRVLDSLAATYGV